MRAQIAVYGVLAAARADRAVPGVVSRVLDEDPVLRHVRLRLQFVAGLHQDAVLRSRGLFRGVGVRHGMVGDGTRLGNDCGNTRRRRGGAAAGPCDRRDRRAPSGNLFRDDHPGAGSAGVLRLFAGGLHGRRKRSARHSARQPPGVGPPRQRSGHVLLRAGGLRRRVLADSPHRAFALRPGAQGDPRQRTASRLPGIQGRSLQAHGLRVVGQSFRLGRFAQGLWCWVSSRCRMSVKPIPAKLF